MPTERRPLDFRTFDQLSADVQRLRENGYDPVGQWTLPQALEHLSKAMHPQPEGIGRALFFMKPVYRFFMRQMLESRRMPRVPAPKSLRPPAQVNEADAVKHFEAAVARAADLPGDTLEHPLLGTVPVVDWQQMQLIHAARHLSFFVPK